jgi:hypothetical protein
MELPSALNQAHTRHTGSRRDHVFVGFQKGVNDRGIQPSGQSHAQQRPDSGISTSLPSECLSLEFTEQLCPGLKPHLASPADDKMKRTIVDE